MMLSGLLRRVGALPAPVVLMIWIVLALAPAALAGSLEVWATIAKLIVTLAIGLFWSGWLWATYARARPFEGKSELGVVWSYVAMPPLLLALTVLTTGEPPPGLVKPVADLLGLSFVISLFTSLWRTAGALEALAIVDGKPAWPRVLSTTVLLLMVYVSPFVAAAKFKAAATARTI